MQPSEVNNDCDMIMGLSFNYLLKLWKSNIPLGFSFKFNPRLPQTCHAVHFISRVMSYLLGSYAPIILKCILNIFWNIKKIQTKNSRVHLHMLYAHKVFREKIICRLSCVKRQYLGMKIMLFVWHVLSFLCRPQKILAFRETVRTHTKIVEMYKRIFLLNFVDN
jgi:hypothetical protein